MNSIYRLIFRRRTRNSLRNSWQLVVALVATSGWLRELLQNSFLADVYIYARDGVLGTSSIFTHPMWDHWLYQFGFSFLSTMTITWVISRIVIDFPGYTKALFWGIMRSYEHNISKAEARVLIGLPALMTLSILSSGYMSLSACTLAAGSIWFHSTSYNLRRLKHRTDEFMRSRSHVGLATPPDSFPPSDFKAF